MRRFRGVVCLNRAVQAAFAPACPSSVVNWNGLFRSGRFQRREFGSFVFEGSVLDRRADVSYDRSSLFREVVRNTPAVEGGEPRSVVLLVYLL